LLFRLHFCIDKLFFFFFSSEQRVVSEQKSTLSRREGSQEISLETDDRVKSFSMVFARALLTYSKERALSSLEILGRKSSKKKAFRV